MAIPIDADWDFLLTGNARYPWNEWFDGQLWKIGPEDVIKASFRELAVYALKVARQRGITIRTERGEYDPETRTYGCLYIQKTSDTRRRRTQKRKA
jgi:hypothetical protein